MFDDDSDLDQELARVLKSYGERAAEGHPSLWPRVRSGLSQSGQRRTRRIPRRWLLPVILLPLLASAGTALAVYSHTSPIVWIFQLSAKPGIGHTDRSYIPPPESVSLKKAGSLLKVSLVLIHGASPTHLRSVTFQGATTARKGLSAPSDKGSVVLVYSVAGQIISLREYHSSPGPLVSKLAGSNISPSGGQTISVITVDGGSYQIEQNSKGQVEFAEWKTLQGVLVVLNGLSPHSLSIDYVRDLLSHTK